jgi:hypothetical protein
MHCWTTDNEYPPLQKPNRTLLPESPFCQGGLHLARALFPPLKKGGRGNVNFYQMLIHAELLARES